VRKISKKILVGLGIFSVVLGFIGIFLPVLPTTPFLLLASACFAKSSPELQEKLLNNCFIGNYLRCYIEKKKIPIAGKIVTLLLLWIGIVLTIFLASLKNHINFLLLAIALVVSTHILLVGRNSK